jgi:asparagine synthetase B (glutamine-hydrolysing)
LFQGNINNVANLKQQYGLNKTANEVTIIIEAYRTLRDRGPYPADQVVRDFQGKFAFILFDSSSQAAFVAAVSKS